jgi:shikimate kinase
MRDHPQAMAQLRNLLRARAPLYSQAEFRVETHGLSIDSVVNQIEEFLGANTHVG